MPRKAERVEITDKFARTLTPPPGVAIIRVKDNHLKRFGVYATAKGVRAYFIEYRLDGKRRHMTVAKVGELVAHKARKKAGELLERVTLGRDPLEEQNEKRRGETLEAFWEQDFLPDAKRRWKDSTLRMQRWHWEKVIAPQLARKRLDSLRRVDVEQWHRALHKTPGKANIALRLLKSVLAKAVEWECIPANPAAKIRPLPLQKRETFLAADEVRLLLDAIAEEERLGQLPPESKKAAKGEKDKKDKRPQGIRKAVKRKGKSKGRGGKGQTESESRGITPHAAALFKLLLYTGARLSEIMHAKWDWIRWEERELIIPDSKTGPRRIPLSKQALAELTRLSKYRTKFSQWIIEGVKPGSHLVNPQKPWSRVKERAHKLLNKKRKDAELDPVSESVFQSCRIHDLRHTAASLAAGEGLSLLHIGSALGHAQGRTTERYSHLRRQAALETVETIGELIEGAGGAVVEPVHPDTPKEREA